MSDMANDEKYEISERDIEVAMRYLKYHDPGNATRDKAVSMLRELQSGFHGMAHSDPARLLELKKNLDVDHGNQ